MRWITIAFLAATFMPGALARAQPFFVSRVVETQEAYFFDSIDSAHEGVVFYLPKAETIVRPVSAVSSAWVAELVLREVPPVAPGALRAEWAGRLLQPYILRPQRECALERVDGMRFITQRVQARGRDVSAAVAAPVCSFSFALDERRADPSTLVAALQQRAAQDRLITRDIKLQLQRVEVTVGWSALHRTLANLGAATTDASPYEAAGMVGVALRLEAPLVDISTWSSAERRRFFDSALTALFVPVPSGLRLVHAPPAGAFRANAGMVEAAL